MRTLPKKAGNISLTLREWGLFCIESRLQGAGGVCYTYGMEESNTHYNKERRLTPMKKLARLTALLLTGALLLVLTACGAASGGGSHLTEREQAAKTKLLKAINASRAELGYAPIKENKAFSEAEEIMLKPFRDTQQTEISEDLWRPANKEANHLRYVERMKLGCERKSYITPEIDGYTQKAYLRSIPLPKDDAALKDFIKKYSLDDPECVYIGLSVAEIKGEMYISYCTFKKAS